MAQAAVSKTLSKPKAPPPKALTKPAKKAPAVKKTATSKSAKVATVPADLVPLGPCEHAQLPLGVLVHSEHKNVRKKKGKLTIRQLADQIKAHTLLQNLVVFAQFIDGQFTGRYEVTAGGRRLEALYLLRDEDNSFTNETLISVKIIAVEAATGASLAENIGREAMHPADEFQAFQTMRDEGHSVTEIAQRFGVEVGLVERRLKLVNVAPALFELYREDKMKLEVLMAFTLTDDHDRQLEVWDSLHAGYRNNSHSVRQALLENKVSLTENRLAKFVGAEAYQAAGGAIIRDLFDSNEAAGYLTDLGLLHTLVRDKLDGLQDEVEGEGWSWVAVDPESTQATLNAFTLGKSRNRKMTPEEAEALASLEAHAEAVEAQLSDLYDLEEPTDEDDEKMDALSVDRDNTAESIAALRAQLVTWPATVKKTAGALITIGHDGQAAIHRGLIRKQDRKAAGKDAAAALAEGGEGADGEGATEQAPVKLSDALHRRLTAQHTAALQLAVARNTHAALVALAETMVVQVLTERSSYHNPDHSTLSMRLSAVVHELKTAEPAIEQSPAAEAFKALQAEWIARIPKEGVATWLTQLAQSELLDLIALCTALTVNVIRERQVHRGAAPLALAANLDMADWWEATAANYFGNVSKGLISQAVDEVGAVPNASEWAKLKKGDMAHAAEELVKGKRWLPAVLRPVAVVEAE